MMGTIAASRRGELIVSSISLSTTSIVSSCDTAPSTYHTLYYEGSNSYPSVGDFLYTDSSLSTSFVGDGDHYVIENESGNGGYDINSSGEITGSDACL